MGHLTKVSLLGLGTYYLKGANIANSHYLCMYYVCRIATKGEGQTWPHNLHRPQTWPCQTALSYHF